MITPVEDPRRALSLRHVNATARLIRVISGCTVARNGTILATDPERGRLIGADEVIE
jgi:hypothetical protein